MRFLTTHGEESDAKSSDLTEREESRGSDNRKGLSLLAGRTRRDLDLGGKRNFRRQKKNLGGFKKLRGARVRRGGPIKSLKICYAQQKGKN